MSIGVIYIYYLLPVINGAFIGRNWEKLGEMGVDLASVVKSK